MPKSKSTFAIVRFNSKTYDGGSVIAVIHGVAKAEARMAEIRGVQEVNDWVDGWRYFLEQTDLMAGMDPQKATRARQARLEMREAQRH